MNQRMPSDSQARAAQELAAQAALELGLVLAAKLGDRQAFGKLAQQYQRQCAAVALRLLGNTHDAMELVQDALVKAFKNLDQLEQSDRFGPWLMRIVTNLALNSRRSRSRRQAISRDVLERAGDTIEPRNSSGIVWRERNLQQCPLDNRGKCHQQLG